MTQVHGYITEGGGLAEQLFRLAVEACPSGMVIIDAAGKIMMVNSEIESQFGYARAELLGQPVEMLVPERLRGQHARHWHHFMLTPEARRTGGARDLFGLRKDGTEFPVEVGLNPMRAGEQLLVLGVIVDISERKQIERLKDEFVATVSHELRTPMTSIAGSLGLLMNQGPGQSPELAMRLLTIAHNNSQRLVRLINDILDMEKIESGRAVFNFVRVDLRQIAGRAIDENRGFADTFAVTLRLDAAPVAAEVSADSDRLVQVMTNLLSNAIKFSPRGSEVLVTIEAKDDGFRISVRDHGSGIPEEFKPRIFGKFAQADSTDSRQKGGTGLGLSIVKDIAERLGAQVGFENAAGGGTIFHVDLPRWDGAVSIEIDVAQETSPRILLCEDDPAVARIVRMKLHRASFTVDFAHSFDLAITLANTNSYSAIIADLRLRGSDGIDLISQIRAQPHNRDTPVVMISGDIDSGLDDPRSPGLNVLEWFRKPIDFPHLIEVLVLATSKKLPIRPMALHVDDDGDILAAAARELEPVAETISTNGAEGGCDAERVRCDDQVNASLSLESLGAAVRDRLSLMPSNFSKETR